MKSALSLLTILSCLALTACGNGSPVKMTNGLTPLPNSFDPKDSALIDAIDNFIIQQGAPPNSEYDYERVDLNNDGLRDGIVLFKLPHTHWCGWDGCGMVVFQAKNNGFTPISTINNVRGPIYIDVMSTRGWRNIIIRVSGTNMPDKNVVLSFDGDAYPQSPLLARTLEFPIPSYNTMTFFK